MSDFRGNLGMEKPVPSRVMGMSKSPLPSVLIINDPL